MAVIHQIRHLFLALRPKQWLKNVIIFIPLIFSGELLSSHAMGLSVAGFVLFSLFAGATYILNDLRDCERDRLHPEKRSRPIARGVVHSTVALVFAIAILVVTLALSYHGFGAIVATLFLAYLLNTIAYSFFVKQIVILDVFSIAFGFVIRGLIGVALISSELSWWFLLLVFFWALWLGFLKRYQEVRLGLETRANILSYNEEFLKQVISMLTTCIIMAYAFYTFNSVQSKLMVVTVPFVVFGMIRYFYHIFFLEKFSHSIEEIILRDGYILADGALFLIITMGIIYFR